MDFRAIKSNDIVIHQGRRHVVTTVDLVDGDVRLHIQPIEDNVIEVSYEDIFPVSAKKSHEYPQRLVAAKTAQSSMQYGWRYANRSSKDVRALPYSNNEVISRIKTLLMDNIQLSDNKFVTQKMLDAVVSRVSMAQGYMIAHNGQSAVKSNRDVATWQHIASVAVRLSNRYNKKLLDIRKI